MYEVQTYENIINRLLTKVNEVDSSLDIRQGSVMYLALAPAAMELAEVYIQLDTVINESFADTATRTYLILRAAEQGIIPTPSSSAIMKGVFNIPINIGARFKLNDLVYKVTELINSVDNTYKLTCETKGVIGHASTGTLIPIEYIDGLTNAEITEILVKGEDEESTESIRTRYFAKLEGEAFGGNEKDYKTKLTKIQGVGGNKIYRATEQGGVFDIYFIDSDYTKPTTSTVEYVQSEINKICPIGAKPQVYGVNEIIVNIEFNIQFQDGYTWLNVSSSITTIVENYLKELREDWENLNNISVRVSQLEVRVMELEGIVDVPSIKINGNPVNLVLGVNDIPVIGSVTNG